MVAFRLPVFSDVGGRGVAVEELHQQALAYIGHGPGALAAVVLWPHPYARTDWRRAGRSVHPHV